MPPSHIFVSSRSRREYPRRRPSASVLPLSMLVVALIALVWALAVLAFWPAAI